MPEDVASANETADDDAAAGGAIRVGGVEDRSVRLYMVNVPARCTTSRASVSALLHYYYLVRQ